MRRPAKTALFAALLAACPFATTQAAEGEGWDWVNAPYLWAASVSTDLREDAPPVGSDTSFSDVVSKLDMAFQVHLEGQGDRFGVFADVTYLDLSDDHDFTGVEVETSINATITELAGVWNVDPARYEGLDVFAGIRHTVTDVDVDFIPALTTLPTVHTGMDQSYTDFMLGARYSGELSGRWGYSLRADGSWGDTEGAVDLVATLRYQMKRGSWVFGYRYMSTDIEENGLEVDMTMHGPMVAFAFGL